MLWGTAISLDWDGPYWFVALVNSEFMLSKEKMKLKPRRMLATDSHSSHRKTVLTNCMRYIIYIIYIYIYLENMSLWPWRQHKIAEGLSEPVLQMVLAF